jgi:arylsulfatase I/J
MKRFLLPIFLVCCSSLQAAQPNIVFILADDLGYADAGYHGGGIQMPHLDRLAAAGAKLESFYGMPVCTPSRSALMTGRYPIRYGRQYNVLRPNSKVGLSLDEKLLPQLLQEAGYATSQIGKWHLGDFDAVYWPTRRGFDHSYGVRLDQHRQYQHLITTEDALQRDEQPVKDTGSLTDLLSREAVRTIEQRDKKKPLFLYLAYHAPHTPLECPPEYAKPYEHLGPQRSLYAGMIAELDEGIGRVVAAVEKEGLRENTLFIFASDNGGLTSKVAAASNAPLRDGKGSLYEGGCAGDRLRNLGWTYPGWNGAKSAAPHGGLAAHAG